MNDLAKKKKIWIDLDNSPHVPLFIPIGNTLEEKGYTVFFTARDCFQVCSLADYYKLSYKKIGRHYGANKFLKIVGTLWRALQLAPVILRENPDLSLSHGSRSLMLLSALLGIPTVFMFDYEHAKDIPFLKPSLGIAPEAIDGPEIAAHFKRGLLNYRGLKEDVYIPSFRPDDLILQKLGIGEENIIATLRPPATEAHYHNPESKELFFEVVEFLGSNPQVRMIILPRNEKDRRELIYMTWPEWCRNRTIIVPDKALNGLNLIWHSDLVVSGGGTMNREAAALGVPAYSIFSGKIGAVDRYLAEKGRLTLIETAGDVRSKILPLKRRKAKSSSFGDNDALKQIVSAIERAVAEK